MSIVICYNDGYWIRIDYVQNIHKTGETTYVTNTYGNDSVNHKNVLFIFTVDSK